MNKSNISILDSFWTDSMHLRKSLLVWLLVFICLSLKSILFHWECFGTVLISTFFRDQLEFWRFYLPKMAGAAFFSSFIFLLKRRESILIFTLLLDFWIEANLIYLRSYNSFLDIYAISMAGNMKGFWNSIFLYVNKTDVIYPFLSFILYGCLFLLSSKLRERSIMGFILAVLFFIVLDLLGWGCYYTKYPSHDGLKALNPYNTDVRNRSFGSYGVKAYMEMTSIFQSPLYIICDALQMDESMYATSLSQEEQIWLEKHKGTGIKRFDQTLILVLVESFEDWVITPEITPNLYHYMQTHPVFYADKIKSEIKGGGSADGQMIINTGLLPLQYGAACFRFPNNTYPGIMHLSVQPAICILPHETNVWNQKAMSPAMGYDSTFVSVDDDRVLFQDVLDMVHLGWRSIQVVTMSTHVPFSGAKVSDYKTPVDMPTYLADYIKAFTTCDKGLGTLLTAIDTDTLLQNATIVITGDHKIFPNDKRDEYATYMHNKGYHFQVEKPYCPLIIISPYIKESSYVTDVAYQMDVYPTILQSVNCEETTWGGVGIGLLKDYQTDKREISEEKAYELCDKIIRNNYFAQ